MFVVFWFVLHALERAVKGRPYLVMLFPTLGVRLARPGAPCGLYTPEYSGVVATPVESAGGAVVNGVCTLHVLCGDVLRLCTELATQETPPLDSQRDQALMGCHVPHTQITILLAFLPLVLFCCYQEDFGNLNVLKPKDYLFLVRKTVNALKDNNWKITAKVRLARRLPLGPLGGPDTLAPPQATRFLACGVLMLRARGAGDVALQDL